MFSSWELSLSHLLDTFCTHTHTPFLAVGHVSMADTFMLYFILNIQHILTLCYLSQKEKSVVNQCSISIFILCAIPQVGRCLSLDLLFSWLMDHLRARTLPFLLAHSQYGVKVGRPTQLPCNRAVRTQFQEICVLPGSLKVVLKIKMLA